MVAKVKVLGALGTVPKPGSVVITEAVNLLTALGKDKSSMKGKLEDMLKVQKHNEEVLKQARGALTELNQLQAKLDKDIKRHEYDLHEEDEVLNERSANLVSGERILDRKMSEFEVNEKQKKSATEERNHQFNQLNSQLKNREQLCEDKEKALASKETVVKHKAEDNDKFRQQLIASHARVRAAVESIESKD